MFYEFKIDLNVFLKNYGIFLALGIVLVIVGLLVFNQSRKKKINKSGADSFISWIEALGDKDNIIEISGNRSRLVVSLKDTDKINRNTLDKLGVKNIIMMNNKITLVINNDASLIAKEINQNLLQK